MTLSDTQRAALRSVRLSWAPTYEEVWDAAAEDTHVDGLHTDVWEDLEDALGDAVASTGASPTGLVITGNAGTGKTHLLTRFRSEVQAAGHYFVLLELLDASDFWRAALTSLRSSLLRPARDHETQLAQLLWLLSDEAGLSRAHRREFSGDAVPTPEGLDALVAAMSKRRPQVRQYHGVLRALVLLGSPDSRLADLGSAFLDDIEVEETAAERLHWGLPAHGFAAVETVRAVSAFMAETAATVFAVDQIDTLLAQSAATLTAPDAAESEVIEQVGHGLMSLRQGLYRTVTVACMLPTAWETLSSRATASVAARFRVVGPLKSLPDGAIARAIVERRLTAAYRAKEFVPPHPTWPIAPEAFASAVHHTPRDLLTKVDAHIRACVTTRTDFELASFDDGPARVAPSVPEPTPMEPAEPPADPPVDVLTRIDEQFEALRIRARVGDVATDQAVADKRMGGLIEAGLRAWTREDGGDGFQIERGNKQLDGRLRRRLPGRVEDEQHWAFRAIPASNAVATTNRVQSAATAAGVAAGMDRRKLFLLRSTPWPTSPKASSVIADAVERGAELLPLDEADLATLDALGRIIANGPDGLDDWLTARRPAHGLRMFAGLDGAPKPAAERPASRRARGMIPGDAVGRVGGLSSSVADVMFGGPPTPRPEPAAPNAEVPAAPAAPSGPAGIAVGLGPDHAPVTVDLAELRKHTAIFAGSGSGKTVLIRRLIEECALRGVSAIVLDPNNDLSRLGEAWPQEPAGWWEGDAERARTYLADTDVVVWTPNRASARPLVLQPIPDFAALRAGMDGDDLDAQEAREGFAMAVEACASALEQHVGVGGSRREQQRAILREALDAYGREIGRADIRAFAEFLGAWDSTRSSLGSADKLAPELAANLQAALINNPLLGGRGEAVDPATLLTPADGKRARISVISLIGLPDETQRQTFVAQLQLALFSWIKRHPAGEKPLGWLLVMDEAQQIAPSGSVKPSTESTLLLASQARKYGLGLVFATQAPKGLHDKIVGNSATHFYGKLNAPVQIQAAKDLAAARGGRLDGIGGLGAGDFYLGAGAATVRLHSPMCLSHHAASPPTEDEVLAIARG
ncbi:helicase HerA domain-containing protein [Tsukamurella sp. DT100]|uniref:helicase HerA domain-containing protein n=1 Tax=Tsukamurella sp. DT100 TaxID=3393415 RepID=UPI003CE7B49F